MESPFNAPHLSAQWRAYMHLTASGEDDPESALKRYPELARESALAFLRQSRVLSTCRSILEEPHGVLPPEERDAPVDDWMEVTLGMGLMEYFRENSLLDDLVARIRRARKQVAETWGFKTDPIRLLDDPTLAPWAMGVRIFGQRLPEITLPENRVLLGVTDVPADGEDVIVAPDPVSHSPMKWLRTGLEQDPRFRGVHQIRVSTVIATILHAVLTRNRHLILPMTATRAKFEDYIKSIRRKDLNTPKNLSEVHQVLTAALGQGVPITKWNPLMGPVVQALDDPGFEWGHALARILQAHRCHRIAWIRQDKRGPVQAVTMTRERVDWIRSLGKESHVDGLRELRHIIEHVSSDWLGSRMDLFHMMPIMLLVDPMDMPFVLTLLSRRSELYLVFTHDDFPGDEVEVVAEW